MACAIERQVFEMQCPFCGIGNSDSAWTCPFCKKPVFATSQQKKFRKVVNLRNGYINRPAAGSLVNLGLRSRVEKLSKVSHLTVPTTPPIGNPVHLSKSGATRRQPDVQPLRFKTQQAAASNADFGKEPALASYASVNRAVPPPDAAYGEPGGQSPGLQFAQPRQTAFLSRGFFSQAALIIGIFALGAATGLGVTWWMKESAATMQPNLQQSSAETGHKNEAAARMSASPAGSGTSAIGASGVSPEELPYDGLAPDQTGKAAAAADVSVRPHGVSGSGSAAKAADQAVLPLPRLSQKAPVAATSTDTGEQPYEGASATVGATRRGSDEAISRSTKPADKARKEVAAAVESGKSASSAVGQPDGKKTATTPQRRRPSQKIANNKEIERIKQQADEELKKKTENRSLATESRAKARHKEKTGMQTTNARSSNIASGSRQARLARCAQASNFIRREHCKWQVCSGMWGKEGCPSYDKQANANY